MMTKAGRVLARGTMMIDHIQEIIKYNELILNLSARELKLKYKNSMLGFFWSFANPLMMTVIYTFAFKIVFRNPEPNYGLFILAALLPWIFLHSSLTGGTNSIINNSNLVKKVYFPRAVIPISFVLAKFVEYLNMLIILYFLLIISKISVGFSVILLPLVLLLYLTFTMGLTLILSSLNVFFRDVSHFTEVALTAWFYLTPIVYSIDLVPEKFRLFLYFNPLTSFVISIRQILIYNTFPSIHLILLQFVYAVSIFCIGFRIFNKLQKNFAEEV